MEKISAVYKITNTITKDFYIGSSKDVKNRWISHKCPSTWKKRPNNQLYKDMQKYGIDKFDFQILEKAGIEQLKEKEQKFIETLKPTYNSINAKGLDVERRKKNKKEYKKSEKYKKYQKEYQKEYDKKHYQQNREKYKKYQKEYYQQKSDKCKKHQKEYDNQLCSYNSEILTLCALATRFIKAGIEHPTKEAKKYLLNNL